MLKINGFCSNGRTTTTIAETVEAAVAAVVAAAAAKDLNVCFMALDRDDEFVEYAK